MYVEDDRKMDSCGGGGVSTLHLSGCEFREMKTFEVGVRGCGSGFLGGGDWIGLEGDGMVSWSEGRRTGIGIS